MISRLYLSLFLSSFCTSAVLAFKSQEEEVVFLLKGIDALEAKVKELEAYHKHQRALQAGCSFTTDSSGQCILTEGLSSFGNVQANNGLSIGGTANLGGMSVSGTLSVGGDVSAASVDPDSTVTVSGDVTLNTLIAGASRLRGDWSTTGGVNATSLDVAGPLLVQGNMVVDGDMEFERSLIANDVNITNDCTLDGDVDFQGPVNMRDFYIEDPQFQVDDSSSVIFNDDVSMDDFIEVTRGELEVDGDFDCEECDDGRRSEDSDESWEDDWWWPDNEDDDEDDDRR